MLSSLACYVEFQPNEGPRLIVSSEEETILNITPTQCNGVELKNRWVVRDVEQFSCYGEVDYFSPTMEGMGFVFDTFTGTLMIGEKKFAFPHGKLAGDFTRIIDLLFSGPKHGPLFLNPGTTLPNEEMNALNTTIQTLLEEQVDLLAP